ncbi:uncharacterized protein SPPG_06607 [Spizellomyces punctatus DAOM BR117]|uniref:Uncharacterized protein n=1 Tax=Spizellomyces punctatus (strain DAOM BR117) TaxID=645134 RepID=A0A0L0HB99_SPIPD|nr:uncharacterized protein SPPG_06607 [Spizellomyces punctatus DAOM BR117]KNC98206.1 hypothetical protein SPPG_06607 [Spizellomyces punctatus DAOM BR117]|eukprot:XP_016606246.1 hypothetical protein SPPG_06607 [Spizellomyces punctatus DAOM BR117]
MSTFIKQEPASDTGILEHSQSTQLHALRALVALQDGLTGTMVDLQQIVQWFQQTTPVSSDSVDITPSVIQETLEQLAKTGVVRCQTMAVPFERRAKVASDEESKVNKGQKYMPEYGFALSEPIRGRIRAARRKKQGGEEAVISILKDILCNTDHPDAENGTGRPKRTRIKKERPDFEVIVPAKHSRSRGRPTIKTEALDQSEPLPKKVNTPRTAKITTPAKKATTSKKVASPKRTTIAKKAATKRKAEATKEAADRPIKTPTSARARRAADTRLASSSSSMPSITGKRRRAPSPLPTPSPSPTKRPTKRTRTRVPVEKTVKAIKPTPSRSTPRTVKEPRRTSPRGRSAKNTVSEEKVSETTRMDIDEVIYQEEEPVKEGFRSFITQNCTIM